jgi:hypothetical protein
MFKSAESQQVTDFAIELATTYMTRCPVGSKKAQPFVTRTINEISTRAEQFSKAQKLGVYGKAKFGTEFKHHLLSAGYEEEFVDALTKTIVMSLASQ